MWKNLFWNSRSSRLLHRFLPYKWKVRMLLFIVMHLILFWWTDNSSEECNFLCFKTNLKWMNITIHPMIWSWLQLYLYWNRKLTIYMDSSVKFTYIIAIYNMCLLRNRIWCREGGCSYWKTIIILFYITQEMLMMRQIPYVQREGEF